MKIALGEHAIENFIYNIPSFFQASFKLNGPPDIPWDVRPTAPDCLVPIYVDSWLDSKDLKGYWGKLRDFEELQSFSLHFHLDMASEHLPSCQVSFITHLRFQSITTQERILNFRQQRWNLVIWRISETVLPEVERY